MTSLLFINPLKLMSRLFIFRGVLLVGILLRNFFLRGIFLRRDFAKGIFLRRDLAPQPAIIVANITRNLSDVKRE